MRQIVLFDSIERKTLLPLTYLRAVSQCQVGLLSIQEKWNRCLPGDYYVKTAKYLQRIYPEPPKSIIPILWINGSVLPNDDVMEKISLLRTNDVLVAGDSIIAYLSERPLESITILRQQKEYNIVKIDADRIIYPEDILNYCDQEFRKDFDILTRGKESLLPGSDVRCRGQQIFIHPTAKVYDCILNASLGPIYIGPNVEIMEQAVIKGPVGIAANSTIHVGAKVYAHTMLGPYSKIGGEIKRTTVFGYSNKAHDGYLGDSVIACWCNLGADTNNSNMKNTYGKVSLWMPTEAQFRTTSRQFLGLIMGDHTMSAINTAFMTGSVTGVFANIFGANYPARWSPSFSWGNPDKEYRLDRAYTVAQRVMSRRGIELTEAYRKALKYVSEL